MDEPSQTLRDTADYIAGYRTDLAESRVTPAATRAEVRAALTTSVPEEGRSTHQVIEELVEVATPGLMSSAGPRYFGFEIGGSTDAALAAGDVMAISG